jgi:hypothetical protein
MPTHENCWQYRQNGTMTKNTHICNKIYIFLKNSSKVGYGIRSYHITCTMSQLFIFLQNYVKLGTFGTGHHFVCPLVYLDQPNTPCHAN